MENNQKHPQLRKIADLIIQIAEDMREAVAAIEDTLPTTKNHYGAYLGMISRTKGDNFTKSMVAVALIKAGANFDGVLDAYRINTGAGLPDSAIQIAQSIN